MYIDEYKTCDFDSLIDDKIQCILFNQQVLIT